MEITLREWKSNFLSGKYDGTDMATQCEAGWYDWFCDDSSLAEKTKKFGEMISRVENDYLLDNYRVWFKNNCFSDGRLYDDMRFEPIDGSLRDTHYFVVAEVIDDESGECVYAIITARSNYSLEFQLSESSEVVAFLNTWTA